jgi:hypothetical protein
MVPGLDWYSLVILFGVKKPTVTGLAKTLGVVCNNAPLSEKREPNELFRQCNKRLLFELKAKRMAFPRDK